MSRDSKSVDSPVDPGARLTQQPVKLAVCLQGFGLGGTELNAIRTLEGLDRRLVNPVAVVLSGDGALRPRFEAAGIPTMRLPLGGFASRQAIAAAFQLIRYLRREAVDVFHSQDVYSNIFGVPCARMAGVPAVVASRRWWRATPRPGLLTVNRRVTRWANHVTTNSDRVRDLVIDEDGVHADRVAVFPNFVAAGAFQSPGPDAVVTWRRQYDVPADALVVGCVARLMPVKGHATLLRGAAPVLRANQAVWLVLVGDGNERASLEALTGELGIAERVRFTGALGNDPNLHHFFDVAVLASTSEAFPNSIVEAMAAGKPVVATRVGGVPDAVVDGTTGLLVPPGDDAAIAAALLDLISDAGRRHRMGLAGRERAQARFRQEVVLAHLADWYRTLVPGKAS